MGLYHYRARAYSPSLGRFLQTDPILHAGGMNLYAYVGNDPMNATDPSGLQAGTYDQSSGGNRDGGGGDTIAVTGHCGVICWLNRTFGGGDGPDRGGIDSLTWGFGQGMSGGGRLLTDGINAGVDAFVTEPTLELTDSIVALSHGEITPEHTAIVTTATVTALLPVTRAGQATRASPNRIFSARVLQRMAQDPGPNHNFPGVMQRLVFRFGERTQISADYVQYGLRGSLNGRSGVYQIGVRPSASGRTEVVTHMFFRPD